MHQTSIKFLIWIVRKCKQIIFFFKYHSHDPNIFQPPLKNHHTTHLVKKKKFLFLSLVNVFFLGNKQEKPRNGRKMIQVGVFVAEIVEHVPTIEMKPTNYSIKLEPNASIPTTNEIE